MKKGFLPSWLKTGRPFGHHGKAHTPQNNEMQANYIPEDEEALHTDKHLPKQSIYGDNDGIDSSVLLPTSLNVLSLIGVQPLQYDDVVKYFDYYGLHPKFEPEDFRQSRGNWIYAIFDRNITDIPAITPVMQIGPHFMVGCYIGRFQSEECLPVPERVVVRQQKQQKLFKIPQHDEDLVGISMEEKTFFNKVREFIFGESEIHAY